MKQNGKAKKAIEVIDEKLKKLNDIFTKSQQSPDLLIVTDRLGRWKSRTVNMLSKYVNPSEGEKLKKTILRSRKSGRPHQNFRNEVNTYHSFLLDLKEDIQEHPEEVLAVIDGQEDMILGAKKQESTTSKTVFIIHGHDKEMLVEVARTLEKLDLDPIILHEQPNKGRTIIEKFTDYSDVNYAIVLLSPDDYGYSKDQSPDKAKPRARQNVIFELGFFIGKLGRQHIFVLYRKGENFEFPSDYKGVLYEPYDESGVWKYRLVDELKAIGYEVSKDKLP